jgi:hypothetical protein
LHLPVLVAVAAGGYCLTRADRRLGRVWVCCALVPAALAAATGAVAPVLLDRTLTLFAWGPLLAIAYLVSALARRGPLIGVAAALVLVVVTIPPALHAVSGTSSPDRVLRQVEQVAGPGDVVAIHPAGRLHELAWSIGVRGRWPYASAAITGLADTNGILLDPASPRSGRVWLLDWTKHRLTAPLGPRCAPDRTVGGARLVCLATAR